MCVCVCVCSCVCVCVRVNLKASTPWSANLHLHFQDQILSTLFPHHITAISPSHKPSGLFPLLYWVFVLCFDFFFLLPYWRPSTAGASTPCCTGVDCCLFIFSVTEAIESGGSKSKSIFLYNLSQRRVHNYFVLMDNRLFGMKWLCDSQSGPLTCGWVRKFILQKCFFHTERSKTCFMKVILLYNLGRERKVRNSFSPPFLKLTKNKENSQPAIKTFHK